MIGPNRYEPVHEDAIVADADGRYVRYADYAAMLDAQRALTHKAERDRDEARKEVVRVRGALNQIAWPASHGLRLETIESLQHIARDTLAILWAPSAIAALTRCTPASREGA